MKATANYALPYPESGDHTRTWEYWQGLADATDALLKARFVSVNPDGSIQTPGSTRPIPFAQLANYVNTAINGQWVTNTITFVAGRFTALPLITASTDHVDCFAVVQAPAATGFTIVGRSAIGAIVGGMNIWYHAVQMTPTSGIGLATRLDEAPAGFVAQTVTCHETGCPNAAVGIPVYVPTVDPVGDPVTAPVIVCGGCQTPITDVGAYV
jgi:hypothetical protein